MTIGPAAITEPRTRPQGSAPTGLAPVVLVTVVVVLAISGLAWWTTRLGGATTVMLLTAAVTTCGTLIVRAAGRSARPSVRRGAVIATVAAGAAILVLASSGALASAKLASAMDAWTADAEGLLGRADAAPYECESFTTDQPELPAFGRIDGRCTSRKGLYRTVTYTQRDPMGGWTGLVYGPDADRAAVQSQCVAHLAGPWWQTASAAPSCPTGFTFVGGG